VKSLLITVPFVLILELVPQIVLIVQLVTSMIKFMLIVNLVNQLTINVLNVTLTSVLFVKLTELLHTVLVKLVMSKLVLTVSHVPITVPPVSIPQKIVSLVFLQELIQTPVPVHMVLMISETILLNVLIVTLDVLDVNSKTSTVLFVLSTDLESQNVHVTLVWLKILKVYVSLVNLLVLPVLVPLTIVNLVKSQEP
jgi:hypothetical protein